MRIFLKALCKIGQVTSLINVPGHQNRCVVHLYIYILYTYILRTLQPHYNMTYLTADLDKTLVVHGSQIFR